MSEHIEATLGDESIIRDNALQPFAHQAANGDILLSCYSPIDDTLRQRNRFPGQAHWLVSRDQGETWEPSKFSPQQPGVWMITIGGRIDQQRYLMMSNYAWRDGDEPAAPNEAGATSAGSDTLGDSEPPGSATSGGAGSGGAGGSGGSDAPAARGPFTTHRWIATGSFDDIEGPIDTIVNVPEAIPNHDDGGLPIDLIVLHRNIVALPSGELLATAYCRFTGDNTPSTYRRSMMKTRVILLASTDQGATWDYLTTIASDLSVGQEGFDEATLIRLSEDRGHGELAGKLICRMRTGSAGSPIYEASSNDDGRTWGRAFPSEACGVDPCLLELSDGRLATSYGTRMWDNGGGQNTSPLLTPTNKVAISADHGQSWDVITEVPMRSP